MKQIVFIMTDTTRFDMLGCYGNKDMKTPNLDKLAKQGIRFDKAYSCCPVCGPARSAIFTGQFPHSNGSFTNSYPLGANVKTVGQRLTDNGIKSAYIGKWHLDGGDYFGLGRCPDGYDHEYWYDMKNYLDELSIEDRLKSRSVETMDTENIDESFTFGHRCSNRAIKYIKNNNKNDFFLTVSYDEPHHPFICPEPYASMYKDYEFPKSENIWDNLEGKPEYQKIWAGDLLFEDKDSLKIMPYRFLGCNSYVDYEIGRVIDTVKEYAPDALIIFTSDHGTSMASHSINEKGAAMYEEIAKIPFIISSPNGTTGVCNNPVSHINITPTILEYFDIKMPRVLEGKSILPTLSNTEADINKEVFTEFIRFEVDLDGFGGLQMMRGITDGRYKLVIHLLDKIDELYDLENDKAEMKNLIDDVNYKDIRNSLHDKLLEWQNTTRDPFRGYQWANRSWRLDAKKPHWENDRSAGWE